MKVATFNTLPSGKDPFWQFVVLPSISVLGGVSKADDYTAITFEWLFWSLSIIIENE